MIKIYTDQNYLNQEFRKLIFPILLDVFFLKSELAISNFQIVNSIEDSDVVIIPVAINFYLKNKKNKELHRFIDLAIANQKKVWAYAAGDYGMKFREDVQVFRLGGLQSKWRKNEFVLPCFVTDPYEYVLKNKWEPISLSLKPSIGFVGHANGSFVKYLKELVLHLKMVLKRQMDSSIGDYQPFFASSYIRYSILKKLQKSKLIQTNFVFRNSYRAGAHTKEEIEQTTLEFFKNIETNPYTLCIRGVGNFSVRLYETLIMGRIPVFIETDSELPLSDKIIWKNHILLTNIDAVEKDLHEFHTNLNSDRFNEIQEQNRFLMLHLLNRVNYFKTIALEY